MSPDSSTTLQPTSSRSLIISPNLDALLEHEERVRGQAMLHSRALPSPESLVDSAGRMDFPVGLPPPPRGSRRPKSPKSPTYDTEKVANSVCPNVLWIRDNSQQPFLLQQPGKISATIRDGTSSSSTNPYINPAPTLDDLGHGNELEAEEGEDGNGRREGNHDKEERQVDMFDGSTGNGGVRPSYSGGVLEQRPHATSQRSHLRTVSLLVDKRLNSCRNIVDLFSDDLPRDTGRGGHHKSLFPRPRPAGQSKQKQGAIRSKKPQHRTGAMAYTLDDNMVLDIRRRASNDFIDITNSVRHDPSRRRPLNSHAPSRRASTDSNSSGSTIGPSTKQRGHIRSNTAQVPNLSETTAFQNPSQDPDRQSFIDFFSPTTPHFLLPPLPPLETSDMLLSRTSDDHGNTTADKQQHSSRSPKSSTSKPMFSLPTSFKSSQTKPPSRSGSPHQGSSDKRCELPPTTNFLDMGERADLVKKSRKLARVFGETPGGDMLSPQEASRSKSSKARSKRPEQETSYAPLVLDLERPSLHATGRRRSIPVTPDELSESLNQTLFQSAAYKTRLDQSGEPSSNRPDYFADIHNKLGSRTSFIELSDEEADDDGALSPITFAPNPNDISPHRPPSPSQLSLYEAMTPEQRAEEERRCKREKLAKLHRFLGSRVPADLVLGVGHLESSLPPIQSNIMPVEESESRKQWLRRRRSSSAGALPSWSDDVDRMKEELNVKEKAINVRRAQKMEKLFGVAPPQTLYHTRHSPSPSVPTEAYLKRSKSPPGPSFGGFIPPGEVPSPTYQQRNPNRSSYIKQRPKKNDRPSTAESSRRLLPEGQDCYSNGPTSPLHQAGLRTSLVYHHYQHSLKSLSDILDRDDKESLAELHQYLNDYEDSNTSSPPVHEISLTKDRRLSNASSIKSERRRSLPARTSMLSIASEYSITTPKPEVSDFQIRRRRAAKLTQFFGVNYRELINDVLESLETGLEHERKRGTLRAEELEDLLERLRKIKTNRKGFF